MTAVRSACWFLDVTDDSALSLSDFVGATRVAIVTQPGVFLGEVVSSAYVEYPREQTAETLQWSFPNHVLVRARKCVFTAQLAIQSLEVRFAQAARVWELKEGRMVRVQEVSSLREETLA